MVMMTMKEREEELALFLEMRNREKENERNNFLLLRNSQNEVLLSDFESITKIVSSENDKSDYDWLVTPPGTPLFPSLEKESKISLQTTMEFHARPAPLKPRVINIQAEPASRRNVASKTQSVMSTLNSSTNGNTNSHRRPSSSSISRPSTPSGRSTLPSTTKSSRPSTPNSRSMILSSAKPVRSSTPTRSSSASKIRPSLTKNSMKSRGSALDAPPELKAERPASTSRSSRLSSLEANSSHNNGNGKLKRLALSSRSCLIDGGDGDSPVMAGTKLVERIVNMRKLALPKLDANHHSALSNSSGKSSSSDGSGFGRTLSNKSLDMAMRHMDIRRSIKGSLNPSNIPSSSMRSMR